MKFLANFLAVGVLGIIPLLSHADYDIQLTNEQYPSATRLQVDVQMRRPAADANFVLGGTAATGFNITELLLDYGTIGTSSGQINFNSGNSSSSLHSDYSVSFGLSGDDVRVQIFNFPGTNLTTITNTYTTLFTLEFDVGANSGTWQNYSITPLTTSTVYNTAGTVIDDNSLSGFSNESLPVDLIRFDGMAISPEVVQLDWATAFEENNEGFYVERSNNGVDFESIDFVAGNATSWNLSQYDYTDHAASLAGKVVYYRLKQVDYDGTHEYSRTITVDIDKSLAEGLKLDVFPNPAINRRRISAVANKPVQLRILSASGKVIYESDATRLSETIDLSDLSPGIYLVTARLEGSELMKTEKLVIR